MTGGLGNGRKYANFFEDGTKDLKEKFVSQEWLSTYGTNNGYNEPTLSIVNDQWPDCQIETNTKELCGIEVTELVDKHCILYPVSPMWTN